jgi:hypothetical protein
MKASPVTCLFVSRDGRLAVRLLDEPIPEQHQDIPPGMQHAIMALGMWPVVRTFKRTVDGKIPVFEEV